MSNTPPEIAALAPERRAAMGASGRLGLLLVPASLVVALATPLGDTLDRVQASLMGGYFYSKLTMLAVIVMMSVPAAILYFPLRAILLRWIRSLPPRATPP